MSFRSRKAPEPPQLPAQPPAPELMDIIDEISGVQTITVTGPDGKKRRHTQRLPLTDQEQQTLDQAKALINKAVTNIETLYKYNPESVVNYQPFIQAFTNINAERVRDLAQIGDFKNIAERIEQFRNINRDLSMREFDSRERMAEETLARRGLQRSTEASELRAAMARERGLLEQQLDVNAQNYGEDLRSRQLEREGQVYNLRESGRQARLQEAETKYSLERQRAEELEALRQNAISENVNLLNVGQNVTGSDTERARLALAGNQGAVNLLGIQANNQNQHYANEINRVNTDYRNRLEAFNNRPASFGRRLMDVGMTAAGAYAGGGISGAMGGMSPAAAGYGFGSRLRS